MPTKAKSYSFHINEHGISLIFRAMEIDSLQYLRVSQLNRTLANAADIFVDSTVKPPLIDKYLELPIRGPTKAAVHYADSKDIANLEKAHDIITAQAKRRVYYTEVFSVVLQHYMWVSHEH